MSRSGYSDEYEHVGLWRQAVKRATTGYRGQHLLRRLRDALNAMPVKRLIPDAIRNEAGEVCALGALDPTAPYDDAEALAQHFGIACALAAEIVYVNDEHPIDCQRGIDGLWSSSKETPEARWVRMRAWVDQQIVPPQTDDEEPTC